MFLVLRFLGFFGLALLGGGFLGFKLKPILAVFVGDLFEAIFWEDRVVSFKTGKHVACKDVGHVSLMGLSDVPNLLTKVIALTHEHKMSLHQSSMSGFIQFTKTKKIKYFIPNLPKVNFFANDKKVLLL